VKEMLIGWLGTFAAIFIFVCGKYFEKFNLEENVENSNYSNLKKIHLQQKVAQFRELHKRYSLAIVLLSAICIVCRNSMSIGVIKLFLIFSICKYIYNFIKLKPQKELFLEEN
jgi:hypothetical protein